MGSASNEVVVRQELLGNLSLVLVRQNAQAILARSNWPVFGWRSGLCFMFTFYTFVHLNDVHIV